MDATLRVCRLVEGYRAYTELLEALGHTVDRTAVAQYLADGTGKQQETEALLSRVSQGDPKGPRSAEAAGQVTAEVAGRMQELLQRLLEEIEGLAKGLEGKGKRHTGPAELARAVRACPAEEREHLGDAVLLNGHRQFLQARYITAEEFRRLLAQREDQGRLALVKLVPFLCQELAKRGLNLPEAEVRRFFDAAAEGVQVPSCLKRIMKGINGEFATGLIDLCELVGERDPDEWLEEARRKLQFRSHSSMHKAIAEATSLKYDCVHKALSGRKKAKRIQAEVKFCLDAWLQAVREGREPDVNEEHRGVPVEEMNALLPPLERKFGTKEKIYRLISARTGIKTGSVRRYFQSNGQLKHAPLAVYRCAAQLAVGPMPEQLRRSYLADNRVRRVAAELAEQANAAFLRWVATDDNAELEVAYKELRRALIVTIKEGREPVPVAV